MMRRPRPFIQLWLTGLSQLILSICETNFMKCRVADIDRFLQYRCYFLFSDTYVNVLFKLGSVLHFCQKQNDCHHGNSSWKSSKTCKCRGSGDDTNRYEFKLAGVLMRYTPYRGISPRHIIALL